MRVLFWKFLLTICGKVFRYIQDRMKFGMSAFLKPPFSEFLHKVRYLILGVPSQQTNLCWIFLSSKNVAFGIAVTKAVAVTYPGQS